MKRQKSEDITSLLHSYLRSEGLETPLNEYRAVSAWNEVSGAARYTENVDFRSQALHVKLRGGLAKQELSMRRAELIRQINEKVGATVVYDIKFY